MRVDPVRKSALSSPRKLIVRESNMLHSGSGNTRWDVLPGRKEERATPRGSPRLAKLRHLAPYGDAPLSAVSCSLSCSTRENQDNPLRNWMRRSGSMHTYQQERQRVRCEIMTMPSSISKKHLKV